MAMKGRKSMLRLNEQFYNPLKWILKEKRKAIGAWLQLASPLSSEILSKAGFDFLVVDMEHAPGDIMVLISQLQAMKGYNAVPLVRVPWNDFIIIKRVLDAGVYGVLLPYVNTKEEVENAVASCKYPLDGIRGIALSPCCSGYGMNSKNYIENANEQIVIIATVETLEAVNNLDDILSVEGLDGIFIGPMDLANSMGHFCNPENDEVKEAVTKVEKKVLASNKFLGTVAGSFEQAVEFYEKGYSFVIVMSDSTSLAKLAMKNVEKFKDQYPDR